MELGERGEREQFSREAGDRVVTETQLVEASQSTNGGRQSSDAIPVQIQ